MRRCPFCTRPLEESEAACPACGRVRETAESLLRRIVVCRQEATDPVLMTGTIVVRLGIAMGLGILAISGELTAASRGVVGLGTLALLLVGTLGWPPLEGCSFFRRINVAVIGAVLSLELVLILEGLEDLPAAHGCLCLAAIGVTAFGASLVAAGVARVLRRPIMS